MLTAEEFDDLPFGGWAVERVAAGLDRGRSREPTRRPDRPADHRLAGARSYSDRKRNDARAPVKAVRPEAREPVVREATIMK